MKKIMLLLCCSLIPWIARGQAAYDWYYWFDSDDAVKTEGNSIGNSFSIITDASGLSQGFHTIHVQVVDTAGVYSPPKTEYFYHTTDRSVVALRYWFDNDMEHMQKVSASGSNYTVDVSSLEPGLHYIYCQIEDASGSVSDVVRSGFYRQIRPTAMTWTYWFDETESTKATVKYPGEAVMVDVSDLTDGFHTIHSQVQEITPSSVETRMFIKTPQTEGVGNMTCICTIDGNLVAQEEVPAQGGIMRWEMDVDSLDVGIHKAMFQAITPSGAASSIAERYFVRAITNKELGSMKCVYSFDNFKTSAQAGTLSNGLFHFDLDVSAMEDGLHRLAYMLVSENGVTTPQKTAFFWKTPLGGSGITQYDYWLNESKNVHSVTLDKRTNPFSLVKLLPVETEPIRSSCFQFELKDGKPMLYAKNDFHIAFYDITGRRVDESKQYVDYNTSTEVTDVAELQSTHTFERPDSNCVKWFKFEAETGDTIAFKASQATSLQVFAPSGEEIYSASGDKSVKYGGAHTWEDGTYYVAVHDVTGSKPNVTLDYMHMDRYDVVAQDVRVVGNGGCSTITFQGNGFRDLYAVDLYTALGDTIHSNDVGHESDAETTVTFDFSGAGLGIYNALFRFAEGEKTLAQIITVEEAKEIELITSVTYPTSFLRGTSTTYTVKITNKGNMTAYGVPVYTYIKSNDEQAISYIKFDGMNLKNIFDGIDINDFDAIKYNQLIKKGDAIGDAPYFISLKTIDEETSDSIFARFNYFFTIIPPNETKTYKLTLKTSSVVDVRITTPEDWFAYSDSTSYNDRKPAKARGMHKASLRDSYCCIVDRIDCFFSLVSTGCDIASPILLALAPLTEGTTAVASVEVAVAGCLSSYTNDVVNSFSQSFCTSDGNPLMNFGKGIYGATQPSISAGTVISCLGASLSGAGAITKGELADALSAVADVFSAGALVNDGGNGTFDCIKNRMVKPYCPPTPPQGGSSTPVNSLDPNDIFGYTAESGSKFVADSIVGLNYRIEFENDTTFATASAHVVEIRDTLDSRVLDLQSYAPTSIKIGEKTESLDGTPNFLKTIDMRPAINAIAQVEGKFDVQKGIATWTFTSLDPMTMEPTDDVMQGFLPVNYDGVSGIGEVSFDINRKAGLADGTEIPNRASIIFDANEPILTPVWTNIIDAVAPESSVVDVIQQGDSAIITCEGTDERSGIWKYEVYAQPGINAPWIKVGECYADSATISYEVFADIDYGFCALAVDSAGNVEKKELEREFSLNPILYGDVNGDGSITISDAVGIVNFVIHANTSSLNEAAADANEDGEVTITDAVFVVNRVIHSNQKNKNLYEKETNYCVTGTRRHANAQ